MRTIVKVLFGCLLASVVFQSSDLTLMGAAPPCPKRPILTLEIPGNACRIALSPDGKRCAVGGSYAEPMLFDLVSGKGKRLLEDETGAEDMRFSPDGKMLAVGWHKDRITLWDGKRGTLLRKAPRHTQGTCALSFSPDGQRIASAAWEDEVVRIWRVKDGKELGQFTHPSYVARLAWSPDGKTIATVAYDEKSDGYSRKLWDAETLKEKFTLAGHMDPQGCFCFSPDGKTIATVGTVLDYENAIFPFPGVRMTRILGAEVKLWDVATGKELATLKGHPKKTVNCLAFSPNGRLLATGGEDTVRLWDVASRKEVEALPAEPEPGVSAVAFTLDGKRLAVIRGPAVLSTRKTRPLEFWDLSSVLTQEK